MPTPTKTDLSDRYKPHLLAALKQPGYDTYLQLAKAFHSIGYLTEARSSYQQALRYQPRSAFARFWLAIAMKEEGDYTDADQALEQLARERIADIPPLTIYRELIALHHYQSIPNQPRQMQILREYAQHLIASLPVAEKAMPHQRMPDTPLRVGFISADFRRHPVAFFLEGMLRVINGTPSLAQRLTLIAYADQASSDDYTARMQAQFDHWRTVTGYSDTDLIQQIHADQIDILIDLAGHTTPNRLAVFAQAPAPLQVSWLGYFRSTGLASIDYVLADPISAPADEQQWFVERLWRLPHLRYCLAIPDNAPRVSPPPCLEQEAFTFGSYQILAKINDRVLACWSQILAAAPQARLRIQCKPLGNPAQRNLFICRLEQAGIPLDRVALLAETDRQAYLASYSEVDMLLDTFPFPGGTTTAEALWLGVPTLTLETPSMLGRQGKALMINAGLSEWVVQTEDAYIERAIGWANGGAATRQRLADLRQTLREQVSLSPVFDVERFAHDFVTALEGMWREKFPASRLETSTLDEYRP